MAQAVFDSITPSHLGWGMLYQALGLNMYQALAVNLVKTFVVEQALKAMRHEQFAMFPIWNDPSHFVADQAVMLVGYNVSSVLPMKREQKVLGGGLIMASSWATRGA